MTSTAGICNIFEYHIQRSKPTLDKFYARNGSYAGAKHHLTNLIDFSRTCWLNCGEYRGPNPPWKMFTPVSNDHYSLLGSLLRLLRTQK
jgi:hypothetical protein